MLLGNKQERHRSRAANLKVFRKMKGNKKIYVNNNDDDDNSPSIPVIQRG